MSTGKLATYPTPHDHLDTLRTYIRRGLPIIPVPRGSDRGPRGWTDLPITTAATVARDFSVLGDVKDVALRLGHADGGYVDVDCDCFEAVDAADIWLPPTGLRYGRPSNPNSHRLYRVGAPLATISFKDPDPAKGERASVVELRGDTRELTTGYRARIPPSSHTKSGERYAWDADGDAAVVVGDDLATAVARVAATALLARRWTAGARHDLANALAGMLARAGWSEDAVVRFVGAVARVAGDEEVDARVATARATCDTVRAGHAATGRPRLAELTSANTVTCVVTWLGLDATTPAAASVTVVDEHYTDTGLARRLVTRFEGELRYCAALGGWHVYEGGRWRRSDHGDVERRLHDVIGGLWEQVASSTMTGDDKKRLAAFAARSEGAYHLKAALEVAATDARIIAPADAFDDDPWLFNMANGTLNLKDPNPRLPIPEVLRRLRRDHAAADLLRKRSPVAFDPHARAPEFAKFLKRIFRGHPGVLPFLQRFVGYVLTGVTSLQQFYLWWGDGGNGKSQLIIVLQHLLGDYAHAADYDTFVLSNRDVRSTRSDLVRLVGARLVSAVETKRVRHLDEGLLKQITGGDTVVARTLYREPVEFTPKFKLVLCANDRPTITGDDHAIWRRVSFIPFVERIADAERIEDFAERVIIPTELPGVLRWALEGCLAWQREGLAPPPEIHAAIADYRSSQDTLAPFFDDHCDEGASYSVRSEAIYHVYHRWACESGLHPMSLKTFTEVLRKRGYVSAKVERARGWVGVALKPAKF